MDPKVKYATAMMNAGSYGPAAQVLGQYLGSHPSDPEALYLLGTAQFRTSNFAAASNTFVKLVSLRPNDPRAHYSFGITMIQLGQLAAARDALETTLRLDPGFTAARQRLAEVAQSGHSHQDGPPKTDTDPATKGRLVVSGRRAVSSMLARFVSSALLAAVGWWIVATRPTAGLSGIAEFFFFLTPGRPARDLREQLEFMERSGASKAQIRAVREELAEAEAALAVTVDRLATLLQAIGVVLVVVGAALIIHGLLLALSTRYQIFEGRIDIREGVLIRRLDSIWLYQVAGVHFEQPLWLAIVGHARLRLMTDKVTPRGRPVTRTITAMIDTEPPVEEPPARFMEGLFHELRDSALSQGVAIKKFWVQ